MRQMRWMARMCAVILVLAGLSVSAQETGTMSLLLVDATKTFASTARVGALAGALRATGSFDLAVCFSDEAEIYRDPMIKMAERPTGTYDLVVFLPRGLDDGTAETIWIVTGVLPWTAPDAWNTIVLVSHLIDKVFAGSAAAVDPSEDLWPAALASVYQAQGWLR